MAYCDLPFPDTACSVPNVYIYHVSDIITVSDTVFIFIHLPRMFLSTDTLFEQQTG